MNKLNLEKLGFIKLTTILKGMERSKSGYSMQSKIDYILDQVKFGNMTREEASKTIIYLQNKDIKGSDGSM